MGEKLFSLAVLKGPGQGRVLRTDRKRISVGSSQENDLVVEDPDISERHFLVLIDHGRWRIHTLSPEHTVMVDRRWTHPTTGQPGALIYAGTGVVLLLFEGAIEERVIEHELGLRAGSGAAVPAPAEEESDLVTRIASSPVELFNEAVQRERTIPLGKAYRADSAVPEVLAEPESQMMRTPRPPPGRNAWGDVSAQRETPVVPPPVNAWGDKKDRASPAGPPKKPTSGSNVWGDPANRTLPPPDAEPPPPPRRERRLERAARAGLTVKLEELGARADSGLVIIRDPDGDFATAIRLLVAKIEERVHSLGYRAYMITSPEALTGKTTAACNLAFALGEDTHRRVALIEANFRYPRFSEILGVPEDHGLIPLLEGRAQLSEMTVKISDRNLVLLPAGGRHANPAQLLASPRFKALIAELAHTVDIALIDAPSVMPFADANLMLPLVDASIFVVAEGRTRATWVAKAAEQLGTARVLGVLYNRIARGSLRKLNRELEERRAQGG